MRLACTVAVVVGFVTGYFWPRGHFELRNDGADTRLCAVSWYGSASCTAPLEGWIPDIPRTEIRWRQQ
jgi:hypothetical protein